MKIAIMQPYFFPYIGYFQLINMVDKFIIYDDVNYINKGWINRNCILVNNGPSFINVPLVAASQNRLIKDIFVVDEDKWKDNLLKTIYFNYKKAPFFNQIISLLEEVLLSEFRSISDLNYLTILKTCSHLNIETELIRTSSIYENTNLKGENRILDICLKENAGTYINPIGGQLLYDKIKFQEKGIELNFIKSRISPYSQNTNSFINYLSIIDTVMFCSPIQIKSNLINQYQLL
jgi:hypothetical protein